MNEGVPISWFDFVVGVMAVVGIMRGRRRGMSQELLDLLMWIGIVVGGAYAYPQAGAYIAHNAGLSNLTSNLLSYLGVAVLSFMFFSMIKNAIKDRLANSNMFGSFEYPLGMLSGAVRFLCMVLMGLALLHAHEVSAKEREETAKKQKDNFGSISFPTLGELQVSVFDKSFCGKWIKQKAPMLLIVTSSTVGEDLGKKDGIGRQKEQQLDKIMGK